MDTKYRSLALISERFGKTYVYSEPSRGLLLYVLDVTNIDKECFLAAFDEASPDLVVDDRDFPRFDFGTFCRSKMFEMLDTRNILYLRSKSLINYDLNKERGATPISAVRVLILHTTEPSRAIDVFSRKARISPEDLRVRILDYKSPNKNIQDNMFEIISLSSDPACFKFRVMDNKGFTRMLACLREALCVSTSVEWEDGETVVLTLEDNSGGVLGQEKVTDIVHWWLSGYKMGNTK